MTMIGHYGREYDVYHYDRIDRTDAIMAYHQAYRELMDAELSRHAYAGDISNYSAIVVRYRGRVLGVLCYTYNSAYITIQMRWVDKDHRGRGIYRHMHERLVDRARDMGMQFIEGYVHKNNTSTIQMLEKLGGFPEHIQYILEL